MRETNGPTQETSALNHYNEHMTRYGVFSVVMGISLFLIGGAIVYAIVVG